MKHSSALFLTYSKQRAGRCSHGTISPSFSLASLSTFIKVSFKSRAWCDSLQGVVLCFLGAGAMQSWRDAVMVRCSNLSISRMLSLATKRFISQLLCLLSKLYQCSLLFKRSPLTQRHRSIREGYLRIYSLNFAVSSLAVSSLAAFLLLQRPCSLSERQPLSQRRRRSKLRAQLVLSQWCKLSFNLGSVFLVEQAFLSVVSYLLAEWFKACCCLHHNLFTDSSCVC